MGLFFLNRTTYAQAICARYAAGHLRSVGLGTASETTTAQRMASKETAFASPKTASETTTTASTSSFQGCGPQMQHSPSRGV
jgi:hypothetical protein